MNNKHLLFIDDTLNMPLMKLTIRSTVVPLQSGKCLIISPTGNLANKHAEIQAMGDVDAIVAPNLFHHLFIPRACRLFPNAKVFGVEGFDKKRPDVAWDGFIKDQSWPYSDDIEHVVLKGMPRVNESVLLHKSSRTLIVTDLCFNLRDAEGIGSFILLSMFGTYRRFAVSRLFTSFIKDRSALVHSLNQIMALDFDSIVMAHGDIIQKGGKDMLASALKERGFM